MGGVAASCSYGTVRGAQRMPNDDDWEKGLDRIINALEVKEGFGVIDSQDNTSSNSQVDDDNIEDNFEAIGASPLGARVLLSTPRTPKVNNSQVDGDNIRDVIDPIGASLLGAHVPLSIPQTPEAFGLAASSHFISPSRMCKDFKIRQCVTDDHVSSP